MILVAGIAAALIAAACLAYYIVLGFWVGFGVNFGMIWPAASAVFAGIAALCRRARKGRRVPAWLWIPGLVLMSVGAAGFLWIESRIMTAAHERPAESAAYCIILGCRVEASHPSLALRYRIDTAAEYLLEHPETIAIASGGQGDDEPISEARCIRDELVARGIAAERILIEERSASTKENILYSMEYIPDPSEPVVIVTSDYHVYRGTGIARKSGLTNVSGLGANPGPVMALHYYVREAFAIVKDYLVGNL